jgi:cytosine/adenosine deaminase-related metal-dependent hydrolase
MPDELVQRAAAGEPYVLRAAWVYADEGGGPALRPDTTVLVDQGRVVEVRPGRSPDHLPCLELPGHLLLPGLISAHTHVAAGTPTRGIIEGGRSFALPLQLVEGLDDEELDALSAHNLAEIVRSGCTTQVEMSLSLRQAASYARVAARWGVRGFVGPMLPGIGRLFPIWFRQDDAALFAAEPGTLAEIAAAVRFAEQVDGAGGGLLRAMIAPHAADTHTPATLRAVGAAARALGTGVHIHLSQSARETAAVRRLWGKTPAAWLAELGLLDGPCLGAHMVGLDWAHDPAILRAHGVVYAHCPSGGGAGGPAQPYPEALGAELATAVAIDTHSNDMLENLKLAVLYGQARHAALAETSPVPMARPTIADALAGSTAVAADGLRRPDLGRIRPGAAADLVAVDVCGPLVGVGGVPPEPLHHLLYANGLAVTHVVVAGRFLVHDGRFVADDEAAVRRAGYAVVQRLWTELERHNYFEKRSPA